MQNLECLAYVLKKELLTVEIIKLWQLALREDDIEPKYICIIRHPFEAAMSLQAHHDLDIQTGHILWLAHTRAALRSLEHHSPITGPKPSDIGQRSSDIGPQERSSDFGHRSRVLGPRTSDLPELAPSPLPLAAVITYDQLLADPVSTLQTVLGSLWLTASRLPLTDLLDFIHPNQKHHQASDLSEPDKEYFKVYAKLYDQIRLQQNTRADKEAAIPAQQDVSLFDPRSADQKRFACPIKHLPGVIHEVSCKAGLHQGLDKSSRRGLTGVQIRLPRETGVPSGVFHWGADSPAQLNRLAESSPQGIQPGWTKNSSLLPRASG